MGNYPVGRLIAEMRRRMGLSQEELAGEICSVSTVSKIENGLQLPSRKVCEGLLQRLGLPVESCNFYRGEDELEKSLIEDRIRVAVENGRTGEVERLLRRYTALCGENPGQVMERQFALAAKGWLLRMQGQDLQAVGELYREAILLTIPQFHPDRPETCAFLTREEIFLLLELAQVSYALGQTGRGKRLAYFLKDYLERTGEETGTGVQWYPQILCFLAKWMERDGFYKRELQLCECGLAACVRWGRLREYPELLASKGYALLALGDIGEAEISLKQACVIFQSLGDPIRAGLVKNKAKLLHQIHPATPGMQEPEAGAVSSGEEIA